MRPPRRRNGGVGQAARHERGHGDRGRLARPRLPGLDGEGGADPRADGRPARAPRRGAGDAGRLRARRGRGGGRRVRVILEPEVETRPWDEQVALDDAAFRDQLAYLRERSPFYGEKLAGNDDVGLADIARLPLTEKHELRTADAPLGRHLCVDPREIVRIYSTSGTTGRPSYIPLTAHDLENWIVGSARSYAASGVEPGERIVSTYNAGPFVAGAALASFDRIGLTHIPIGTGNTDRLLRAVELLRPEAVVTTPSYAAYLAETNDLTTSSVQRVLVAGEPGGGEPTFRRQLEDAWGARVTEAMGIGDIGVSLWGECEHEAGMHLGARGFVHAE